MPKKKVVLAAAAALAAATVIFSVQRRDRRYWVRPSLRARQKYSGSDLLNDLNKDDTEGNTMNYEIRCDGSFKNFLRMSSVDFEYLLAAVGQIISKQDTTFRDAIPAREKLAITLRFLASGDSYQSLSYLFKVSKSSISLCIPLVCDNN